MENKKPTEADIGEFWWCRSTRSGAPLLLEIAKRDGMLVGKIQDVTDIPADHPGIQWEGPIDPTWRIREAIEGKAGQQQILNK